MFGLGFTTITITPNGQSLRYLYIDIMEFLSLSFGGFVKNLMDLGIINTFVKFYG